MDIVYNADNYRPNRAVGVIYNLPRGIALIDNQHGLANPGID